MARYFFSPGRLERREMLPSFDGGRIATASERSQFLLRFSSYEVYRFGSARPVFDKSVREDIFTRVRDDRAILRILDDLPADLSSLLRASGVIVLPQLSPELDRLLKNNFSSQDVSFLVFSE